MLNIIALLFLLSVDAPGSMALIAAVDVALVAVVLFAGRRVRRPTGEGVQESRESPGPR